MVREQTTHIKKMVTTNCFAYFASLIYCQAYSEEQVLTAKEVWL